MEKPVNKKCICKICGNEFLSADIKACYCFNCQNNRKCKKCKNKKIHYLNETGLCRSCALKGTTSSLKGKTYKEIYGDKIPTCGFKKGKDNIAKREDIRKKISESVKKSYTNELRQKRREAAYKSTFVSGNSSTYKYEYNGIKYRSNLEAYFAKFLTKNKIKFEYEVKIRLINNRLKFPDFKINNILIEITGYGHPAWRKDFQQKIKLLRKSCNNIILILTYPQFVKEIWKMTDENIFIGNVYDHKRILKTLKFGTQINEMNKILKNGI